MYLVKFSNESKDLVHASQTGSTADFWHFLVSQLMKTWSTLTLLKYCFIGSFEEAIGHFVSREKAQLVKVFIKRQN